MCTESCYSHGNRANIIFDNLRKFNLEKTRVTWNNYVTRGTSNKVSNNRQVETWKRKRADGDERRRRKRENTRGNNSHEKYKTRQSASLATSVCFVRCTSSSLYVSNKYLSSRSSKDHKRNVVLSPSGKTFSLSKQTTTKLVTKVEFSVALSKICIRQVDLHVFFFFFYIRYISQQDPIPWVSSRVTILCTIS